MLSLEHERESSVLLHALSVTVCKDMMHLVHVIAMCCTNGEGYRTVSFNPSPSHPALSKVQIIIIIIIIIRLLLTDAAIPGDGNMIKKDKKIFKYKAITHNRDSAHVEC
jgi:hypothetical protein